MALDPVHAEPLHYCDRPVGPYCLRPCSHGLGLEVPHYESLPFKLGGAYVVAEGGGARVVSRLDPGGSS